MRSQLAMLLPLLIDIEERNQRQAVLHLLQPKQEFRFDRIRIAERAPGNERDAIGRQNHARFAHGASLDLQLLREPIVGK
jgi:hypothetical protein